MTDTADDILEDFKEFDETVADIVTVQKTEDEASSIQLHSSPSMEVLLENESEPTSELEECTFEMQDASDDITNDEGIKEETQLDEKEEWSPKGRTFSLPKPDLRRFSFKKSVEEYIRNKTKLNQVSAELYSCTCYNSVFPFPCFSQMWINICVFYATVKQTKYKHIINSYIYTYTRV